MSDLDDLIIEGLKRKNNPTNADRIRGMTDEELAVVLETGCPCQDETDCNSVEIIKGEHTYEHCRRCILKWLKEPVKEGKP